MFILRAHYCSTQSEDAEHGESANVLQLWHDLIRAAGGRKKKRERERERERARERTIIRVKTEHWYDQGIMGGVPSSLPNTPPPPPLPPLPYWFILKTTFTLRGGRHSRCRKNKSPECSTEIQTQLQETASFIYSAKEKYSQGNITFSMMIIKT